eukprot:CAMPEP_0196572920 /NCGR_PEP_ID=MMETSP1081-20130531/2892_1 /TAXON_ID=36882 /ORGANISM="Pyramimonas amylifera, Strain CCMP720" /LENGTH=449 /DNA_ID=CAMNT_0041890427 /DNA_START=29 /DNA_END=1378 /DNA_ORIENTATION=-
MNRTAAVFQAELHWAVLATAVEQAESRTQSHVKDRCENVGGVSIKSNNKKSSRQRRKLAPFQMVQTEKEAKAGGTVVWVLPQDQTTGGTAKLAARLACLAGVRRHLRMLCYAHAVEDICQMMTSKVNIWQWIVGDSCCDSPAGTWTLSYDLSFPPADSESLPFHCLQHATSAAILLSQAIPGRFIMKPELGCVNLVMVELKEGFILAREISQKGQTGEATHTSFSSFSTPEALRIWSRRPFSFSASLDTSIALAVLNITLSVHALKKGGQAPVRGLLGVSLLDPCCGSGTIPAMAAHLGVGRVWGADVNPSFLNKAQTNFDHAGLKCRRLNNGFDMVESGEEGEGTESVILLTQHDARRPFGYSDREFKVDVVVGNPPWGKNIGVADESVAMILNILRSFPMATSGFVVSYWTLQQLRKHQMKRSDIDLEICENVKIGACALVVLQLRN